MHFSVFAAIVPIVTAALSMVAAAPAPEPDAAQSNCNYAYDGMSADKRGPGFTYSCKRVSFTVTSYVCYIANPGSGGQIYCCSGDRVQTSAGPMVGGCELS
ncbi:hypothetical protein BDZ89DRAFT_1034518 [Hymenopellis radicata]|nr:hypothetical protein BDZ89DRAFT_1034518 [Hymenopellis radicata]